MTPDQDAAQPSVILKGQQIHVPVKTAKGLNQVVPYFISMDVMTFSFPPY